MTIGHIYLHRRDDSQNEFRELLLWQDERFTYVEQVFGFLSSPDPIPIHRREMMSSGSEWQMRKFIHEVAKRLSEEEGFTITESTLSD